MYNVIIIGAGVIGCSVARALAKYKLNVCVIEKEEDVASGTTKANSAIVHAGFDADPDSLKGKLNAKGNAMFDQLSKELDFPLKRIGSLVVCFDEKQKFKLDELLKQGEKNGVPGLRIVGREELRSMEPNITDEAVAALFAPTGAITCPYEMTIALAENAVENGVEFKLDTRVENIAVKDNKFIVKTSKGEFEAELVINAAGVYVNDLNNMVSEKKMHIIPRKGQYCLFDKAVGNTVSRTIFQLPTKMGKGILVTPTVDGNLLIGPNAIDIEEKDNMVTTSEGIQEIISKAKISIREIPMNQVITSFSGLRAHEEGDDFIIGEPSDAKNFINIAGIESPGLSSAPAIALMVEEMVVETIKAEKKENFNPKREGIPKFREMTNEERKKIISDRPEYGRIICRCETITEGEIIDSIKRPLGARTLDAVKRRTRAGMGRCQAGFCSTRIVEIIARELGLSPLDITKFGGKSNLLIGKNKEEIK